MKKVGVLRTEEAKIEYETVYKRCELLGVACRD